MKELHSFNRKFVLKGTNSQTVERSMVIKMMGRIGRTLRMFSYICTSVTLVSAVYIRFFWGNIELSYQILWQILGISLVTSLGFLLLPDRELGRRKTLVIQLCYYAYVNLVVLTAGAWFEWFEPDRMAMVVGMLVLIAVIFGAMLFVQYRKEKHLGDRLNEKLKERYSLQAEGRHSI